MKEKRSIIGTISFFIILISSLFLLCESLRFQRDGPTPHSVTYLNHFQAKVDGADWEDVTLPYTFKNLEPRTHVTLRTLVKLNPDDSIFFKTVYSPAKVYIDNKFFFEFGKKENYPDFMIDPATEIHMIESYGDGEEVPLTLEVWSPISRDSLIIHPLMIGTNKELIMERSRALGLPFTFSVIQLVAGLALMLISVCILFIDKKGAFFFWLGLFSFDTGLWAFGENNFTGIIFKESAFLYLISFIGLFSFVIPLIRFTRTIIDFVNPKPLKILEIGYSIAVAVALVLQLTGTMAFSKSMYFFHVLLPPSLIFLTSMCIAEYFLYKNKNALRFTFPLAILASTAVLELLNYNFTITYVFSSIFQMGILLFLLIMGLAGGFFMKDTLELRNKEKELAHQSQILTMQTEEQKKNALMLAANEKQISRQRHDLRHHLNVLQELGGESNVKLQEYLKELIGQIPPAKARFCENDIVNSVLSHYASLCEQKKINFSAKLDVPELDNLSTDSNLCVIFSNLLENAVEACDRMTEGEKFITLRSKTQFDMLTITMDNSFNGILFTSGDKLHSAKRSGAGIGIASIKAMAQSLHGDADFHKEDKVFLSSVYLKLK